MNRKNISFLQRFTFTIFFNRPPPLVCLQNYIGMMKDKISNLDISERNFVYGNLSDFFWGVNKIFQLIISDIDLWIIFMSFWNKTNSRFPLTPLASTLTEFHNWYFFKQYFTSVQHKTAYVSATKSRLKWVLTTLYGQLFYSLHISRFCEIRNWSELVMHHKHFETHTQY